MQQMFPCPICGVQNYIGQKFCGGCGQRLDYNCPQCGAVVDSTMTACPNCFTPLSWSTPPSQQPPLPQQPPPPQPQQPPPPQQPPIQQMAPPPSFQQGAPYYQEQQTAYRYGSYAPRRKKPFPYAMLALIVVAVLLIVGGTLYALDMLPFVGSSDEKPPASDDTTPADDITLPEISGITSDVTSTTATISWTTDKPTTGQVVYGTTADYGMFSEKDDDLATSHSITLTSLEEGMTYHFQVISADADGNEASSTDKELTTIAGEDTTPPEITGISDNATATAATIKWTTSEPATTQVDYGLTDSYGTKTTLDSQLVTSHSVTLTGLAGSTTYYYQVISQDAAGNPATSTGSFDTIAADDTTEPNFTYIVADELTSATDNSTTTIVQISWGTDEVTNSQVEYGTSIEYGEFSELMDHPPASNGRVDHAVTLEGLERDQTYHYRVISVDAGGNKAISDDKTFKTRVPPSS